MVPLSIDQTPMQLSNPLLLILAGPIFFLIAVISVSTWLVVVTGTPPADVAKVASEKVPLIMVVALTQLTMLAAYLLLSSDVAWRGNQPMLTQCIVAIAIATLFAVLYISVVSPWHTALINRFGDYVPAGTTTQAFKGSLVLFFVANVLLAPIAEEVIYRGYLFESLSGLTGPILAIVIGVISFGLLHWLGGFWYMMITGLLVGGLLIGLRIWSGGVFAPFLAHLTMNVIEFCWIAGYLAKR